LRKNDAFYGSPLDTQILQYVQRLISTQVDAEAPTWDELHTEQIHSDAQEKAELLDVAFDENGSLEDQLKKSKARIAELVQENMQLKAKTESLECALKASDTADSVLRKSSIPEFFEGEQHDLVVNLLEKAIVSCGTVDTRQRELLLDILAQNHIIGKGKEMLEVVKSVFADGENITSKQMSELKQVGFEVVSENTHYNLSIKVMISICLYWRKAQATVEAARI